MAFTLTCVYLKRYTQSTALLDFVRFSSCAQQNEKRERTRRGMIVLSRSRNRVNYCPKIRRHNKNHGSYQIKYFFLISRRIIMFSKITVHCLLACLVKSRFTRKKQAISCFIFFIHCNDTYRQYYVT